MIINKMTIQQLDKELQTAIKNQDHSEIQKIFDENPNFNPTSVHPDFTIIKDHTDYKNGMKVILEKYPIDLTTDQFDKYEQVLDTDDLQKVLDSNCKNRLKIFLKNYKGLINDEHVLKIILKMDTELIMLMIKSDPTIRQRLSSSIDLTELLNKPNHNNLTPLQRLAKLGKIKIIKALYPKRSNTPDKAFLKRLQDSCFIDGEEVAIQALSEKDAFKRPYQVAQVGCDTKVKLQDGRIVTFRGVEAEDAHKIIERTNTNLFSEPYNICSPVDEKIHTLRIHMGGGHYFLTFKTPLLGYDVTEGLYPGSDNKQKEQIEEPHDYSLKFKSSERIRISTQSIQKGNQIEKMTLSSGKMGIYSQSSSQSILSSGSSTVLGSSSKLQIKTSGIATDLAEKMPWKMLFIRQKGIIQDEKTSIHDCEVSAECPAITFHLDSTQMQQALTYATRIKQACLDGDIDECGYSGVFRNCIDFVSEIAEEAGIENPLPCWVDGNEVSNTRIAHFWERFSRMGIVNLVSQDFLGRNILGKTTIKVDDLVNQLLSNNQPPSLSDMALASAALPFSPSINHSNLALRINHCPDGAGNSNNANIMVGLAICPMILLLTVLFAFIYKKLRFA